MPGKSGIPFLHAKGGEKEMTKKEREQLQKWKYFIQTGIFPIEGVHFLGEVLKRLLGTILTLPFPKAPMVRIDFADTSIYVEHLDRKAGDKHAVVAYIYRKLTDKKRKVLNQMIAHYLYRYWPRLLANMNRDHLDQLVDEVLPNLYKRLFNLDEDELYKIYRDEKSFKLRKFVENCLRSHFRRIAKQLKREMLAETDTVEYFSKFAQQITSGEPQDPSLYGLVQWYLSQLPSDERRVIVKLIEGHKPSEIMKELGISERKMKTIIRENRLLFEDLEFIHENF